MQGQRGVIGSSPDALNFDHGSTSSNTAVEHQICWNNMQNPVVNGFPDYMLAPDDVGITHANSFRHEQHNLNGWSLGEPCLSASQDEVSLREQKTEHGWSSSVEPFAGSGDDCQVMEGSNLFKSTGSHSNSSEPCLLPSGSGGYLAEENDSRPGCSFEGRRASRKRKAVEGNAGPSYVGGSCSRFQPSETSSWPVVPRPYNISNNMIISAPAEEVTPRLGFGVRGPTPDSSTDSTAGLSGGRARRNFCMRTNSTAQQESNHPTVFSMGGAVRHSSGSSSQQLSRLLPADHSLELRAAQVVDNATPPGESSVTQVPALLRNVQSFRWHAGSSSRTGSSSSSNISGNRDVVPHVESSSRNLTRNMLEHPMFVPAPELRNLVRNPPERNLTGGNINFPGNIVSTTAQKCSSAGVPPLSASGWAPHPNPPQHPRRFSDYVRRSLFTPHGIESGGLGNNQSPLQSSPASSEEMVLLSGTGNQVRRHSYPRSAAWMEREGDGVLGIPHSLRTLASEGRSRLVVSEIRNVLDLMRRGESLRFEDVMILDQSVFFGMADIHDRHRDMRLDVDNMSYEELLALEERIGNVSTGLSEETILDRLKQHKYFVAVGVQLETEPCCICQEEYVNGEDLGTLECGHDFHTGCIKQWLMHKNLCPICKTTALTTI